MSSPFGVTGPEGRQLNSGNNSSLGAPRLQLDSSNNEESSTIDTDVQLGQGTGDCLVGGLQEGQLTPADGLREGHQSVEGRSSTELPTASPTMHEHHEQLLQLLRSHETRVEALEQRVQELDEGTLKPKVKRRRTGADKEFQQELEGLDVEERDPQQDLCDLSIQTQGDLVGQATALLASEFVAKLRAKVQVLEARVQDQDTRIKAAANGEWAAVQPFLDDILKENNMTLLQQRDVLMKDLERSRKEINALKTVTKGLMDEHEASDSYNASKLEKKQHEIVQLRTQVSQLEKAAEQAEFQRKRSEQDRIFEARMIQGKMNEKNNNLQAKVLSLELACNDMKPKIGKLQEIVQKARRTREAFLQRWGEIKHLTSSTHKERQLLAALAEIVDDELQE